MYQTQVIQKILHFKEPAGTSRGIYTTHKVWYVKVRDIQQLNKVGIGECAPLPNLSCDDVDNYHDVLLEACKYLEEHEKINRERLIHFPSILFGLETALLHLKSGSIKLFDTPFSRGEEGIPINGLIWMGEYEEMLARIKEKLNLGFHCIKLKIGAIDFNSELDLIKKIREQFTEKEIEIRVDANGAFHPDEALDKLNRLSEHHIHSIEQPIKAGNWESMAELCEKTPISIALDEELIGRNLLKDKLATLEIIKPQYIILKPSLHGGISGSKEWIEEAENRKIGWWITSALESNVGLNAIAQWCATLGNTLPQGLGTGQLFTDNIKSPLEIRKEKLWFNHKLFDKQNEFEL